MEAENSSFRRLTESDIINKLLQTLKHPNVRTDFKKLAHYTSNFTQFSFIASNCMLAYKSIYALKIKSLVLCSDAGLLERIMEQTFKVEDPLTLFLFPSYSINSHRL
jgi:hypothetical protein